MAPRSNAVFLAIIAAMAALLAILSVPSLIAALIAFPSGEDLERLRRGAPPPPFDLTRAAERNMIAAGVFESARYRANAASALLALPPAERRRTGVDVEDVVRASLRAAPAQTYNWSRLAALRLAAGDRPGAMRAWQMSVLTSRYEPGLMLGRINLALALLPTTDRTMIDLTSDQIRLAAEADIRGLAKAAYTTGTAPYVSAVLWRDTTRMPLFLRYYRDHIWAAQHPDEAKALRK
ncbi:hypothetical protein [Sphingomonas montanisoli]|uniref:Uncharacterized protein n=1 Tax=Sphingomonas montanisoli TaxID=2606412 RepID=A0A5D9C2F6_9SPHN|nr:hypothetical protein [Sphingomonas montanisoli]TZG25839.1 hypothetical protein FYJ91_12720 [Sphingomonas montanisoli]